LRKKLLFLEKKVVLSFLSVDMLSVAFLNQSIGQLYAIFSEDYIKASLSVTNLSSNGADTLKRVVDNAKDFYRYPNARQESIDKFK
jgi:hypothetical protein